MFFKKWLLPWTAAEQFKTEQEFQSWLKRRHRGFTDLRMVLLVIAAAVLLVGYVLDRRPVMLLTIIPLVLLLLATMALDQIEKRMGE